MKKILYIYIVLYSSFCFSQNIFLTEAKEIHANNDKFLINHRHRRDDREHQISYLKKPTERINFATDVFNLADAYRHDDARAMAMLDALNGTDKMHQKRGMFLVEENTADGGGGAFYIDGANRIFFTNISFANNKAVSSISTLAKFRHLAMACLRSTNGF